MIDFKNITSDKIRILIDGEDIIKEGEPHIPFIFSVTESDITDKDSIKLPVKITTIAQGTGLNTIVLLADLLVKTAKSIGGEHSFEKTKRIFCTAYDGLVEQAQGVELTKNKK